MPTLNHHPSTTPLDQDDLVAAVRGNEFKLDYRYGQHLNVIYVAMLLSSGLPIAYLSATIWFTVAYWMEKWWAAGRRGRGGA